MLLCMFLWRSRIHFDLNSLVFPIAFDSFDAERPSLSQCFLQRTEQNIRDSYDESTDDDRPTNTIIEMFEVDDERPVPEPLKKAQAENKRLQSENNRLIAALLKTTQLKKSIQAMQKKLLVELADLIRETYGEHDAESETQESD